jgi:hypothetical protein
VVAAPPGLENVISVLFTRSKCGCFPGTCDRHSSSGQDMWRREGVSEPFQEIESNV